jgi:hypothetical protein
MQVWICTDLPKDVGFQSGPLWWPIPPLVLAGLLVALTIRYLPRKGGHSPAGRLKVGGGPPAPAANLRTWGWITAHLPRALCSDFERWRWGR